MQSYVACRTLVITHASEVERWLSGHRKTNRFASHTSHNAQKSKVDTYD